MVLYEYFNTTNQTSPHFERHENFVMDIKLPSCALVQSLPYEERCAYVHSIPACYANIYFFNYIDLLYCDINAHSPFVTILGVIMLFIICGIVFIILGSTADCFFCPSLTVLSRMLGLSENVAGVTLLAFGNGAPDMFTSMAGMKGESRRLYSDIFAAAVFVVFMVAGNIVAFMPFCVQPESFLRDALFLILDVLFIDYCLKKDYAVSALESGCILFIYLCYIFVVIVDQFLVKMATRKFNYRSDLRHLSTIDTITLNNLRSQGVIEHRSRISLVDRRNFALTSQYYEPKMTRSSTGLFEQFVSTLNPYHMDEWQDATTAMRMFLLLRMPILCILTFLIPIVDIDMVDHGWSKLLNCIQIIILPSIVCYGTLGTVALFNVPIFAWFFIVTMPLAIFVFFVTRTDEVPANHKYFSILGVLGSSFIVYACAAEIISILDVLGITTTRSNSFIGCTLLAWGNSIGDLMANLALSRQGYQKMALAACFGGPLFNSLLAVGSSMFYKSLMNSDFMITEMGEGTMGENCTIFLAIGVASVVLAVTTTNFAMRRSIGIFMILFYCTFICYTLLGEFEIIHTYGSDHRMDLRAEPLDY